MTATQSTNYTALVPGFSQSSSTTLEISHLTHKTYFFACFFFFLKLEIGDLYKPSGGFTPTITQVTPYVPGVGHDVGS